MFFENSVCDEEAAGRGKSKIDFLEFYSLRPEIAVQLSGSDKSGGGHVISGSCYVFISTLVLKALFPVNTG